MIQFKCDSCGKKYSVDPKHAGRRVKCRKCQHVNRVPRSETLKPHQALKVPPDVASSPTRNDALKVDSTSDGVQNEDRKAVRRGRRIVIYGIGFFVGFPFLSIMFNVPFLLGHSSVRFGNQNLSIFIWFLLSSVLWAFLYTGREWARRLMSNLLVFGVVGSLITMSFYMDETLDNTQAIELVLGLIWIIGCLITFASLEKSPDVARFLDYQRRKMR